MLRPPLRTIAEVTTYVLQRGVCNDSGKIDVRSKNWWATDYCAQIVHRRRYPLRIQMSREVLKQNNILSLNVCLKALQNVCRSIACNYMHNNKRPICCSSSVATAGCCIVVSKLKEMFAWCCSSIIQNTFSVQYPPKTLCINAPHGSKPVCPFTGKPADHRGTISVSFVLNGFPNGVSNSQGENTSTEKIYHRIFELVCFVHKE